jgi:6-pyruvoyltetrahydropterin/6-carboxytetrahydropterin synthase
MATATVSKSFTLQAAHQLPDHDGKCRQLHGHSYRIDVEAHGPIQGERRTSDEGMVLDFAVIKLAWAPFHQLMDHRFLNEVIPTEYHPTTAENIARWLLTELRLAVPQVVAVRVHETEGCWAEVRA